MFESPAWFGRDCVHRCPYRWFSTHKKALDVCLSVNHKRLGCNGYIIPLCNFNNRLLMIFT